MKLRPVVAASGRSNVGCDHKCVPSEGSSAAAGSASKPFHLWQIRVRPSSSQRTFQKAVLPEKIARRPPARTKRSSASLCEADQYSLWPTRIATPYGSSAAGSASRS
ncbi:MAG: MbtH family NRPS accessory protein [Caulobacteraceae bacterium]|nr:MbtH family NRPS accessory protein [Caulobacteraceae bacterium]